MFKTTVATYIQVCICMLYTAFIYRCQSINTTASYTFLDYFFTGLMPSHVVHALLHDYSEFCFPVQCVIHCILESKAWQLHARQYTKVVIYYYRLNTPTIRLSLFICYNFITYSFSSRECPQKLMWIWLALEALITILKTFR